MAAACAPQRGNGSGGQPPPISDAQNPVIAPDQIVAFAPRGLPAYRTHTVGVLNPMPCPWPRQPLRDSAQIGPKRGEVVVRDPNGTTLARLIVPDDAVHGDPVWFHVRVHQHPRQFIVDVTRDVHGVSPAGYTLELTPPCAPELASIGDVWLVRAVGGPVADAIRREPPSGNDRVMRFTLSRLSRFVISH